ncbi:MAG TPA: ribosome small subunit-dependent GTPase A [Spirochaetota bacterium]|nr:ribosome small subunit-dependent GTPase A [Spirochaetota bacterium]
MKLEDLGWNESFSRQYGDLKNAGLIPGRVIYVSGPQYGIETEAGRVDANISGHFQYTSSGRADYPAAGDWVLLRGDSGAYMIDKVLERESVFSRKGSGKRCDEQVIAANIDIMFIVASLDGGRNFTLRGIERYIVMVRDGGAEPVILLNKCDLCADRDNVMEQVHTVSGDIPVFMVSALTGEGMEHVTGFLAHAVTAAFTGPSGAGKSALINSLIGTSVEKTGSIREDDKRGRHTTTHRELFFLSWGAMVIDTPGLRELSPYGDVESLDLAFADIAEASSGCRFSDCSHTDEPGCEVIRLVNEGEIDSARYRNYISIRGEMEFLNSRKDVNARLEKKAKEKTISKLIKDYYK